MLVRLAETDHRQSLATVLAQPSRMKNTQSPAQPTPTTSIANPLTVRFLVSGSGTWTAEFLRLASSVIGNEECSVVLYKGLLQLVLGVFVNVFLVVGDD